MASKVSRIEFAAIVAVLLLSSSVSGTFVYVEIIERTPPIDAADSKLGCYPAAFTDQQRNLTDVEVIAANPSHGCEELSEDYQGKTVVMMRGYCTFKQKVERCQAVGAAGIIVVNDHPDLPTEMSLSSSNQDPMSRFDDETLEPNGIGIPACMAMLDAWDLLSEPGTRVSWEGFRKYRWGDERLPENDITKISISQLQGPYHDIPAGQATFNPVSAAVEGRAVLVEFADACAYAANEEVDCDACGVLDHQVANHAELNGNVGVVYLDPWVHYCFSWLYEFTVLVQRSGGTGLVFVNMDEQLWTYVPWLVPYPLEIPMLNIMRSHGIALYHRLELGQDVAVRMPALQHFPDGCDVDRDVCVASGPNFEVQDSPPLGSTALLFVDYSGPDEPQRRLCEAGQARFNPLETAPESSGQSYFSFNAPIALTAWPAQCALDVALSGEEDACHPCSDAANETMYSMGDVDGKVALIFVEEVSCVGTWHQIVGAAHWLGAVGVVFATNDERIGTITADSQTRASIPAFLIRNSDAVWIQERAQAAAINAGEGGSGGGTNSGGSGTNPLSPNDRRRALGGRSTQTAAHRVEGIEHQRREGALEGVQAFLPRISDGRASEYDATAAVQAYMVIASAAEGDGGMGTSVNTSTPPPSPPPPPPPPPPTEELRTARLTVKDRTALSFKVTAMVAKFMAPRYSSVVADAVWMQWHNCGSQSTCAICQAQQCEDIKNKADLAGAIAVVWQQDIPCYDQDEAYRAAYCAQLHGASGVLYITNGEPTAMPPKDQNAMDFTQLELCKDGIYRKICVPVFSISLSAAEPIRKALTCSEVPEGERARCRVRLSEDPQMRIETPSSTNTGGSAAQGAPAGGAGVTQAANANLRGTDENRVKPKPAFPVYAIVIIVLAAIFAGLLIFSYTVWRKRQRRRAYITSAIDQGTQFHNINPRGPGDPSAPSWAGSETGEAGPEDTVITADPTRWQSGGAAAGPDGRGAGANADIRRGVITGPPREASQTKGEAGAGPDAAAGAAEAELMDGKEQGADRGAGDVEMTSVLSTISVERNGAATDE